MERGSLVVVAVLVALWPLPLNAQVLRRPEPRPDVLRAEPGTAPPEGYRSEDRIRAGAVIAGAITSAAGGLIILAGVQEHHREHGEDSPDYSPLFYVWGGAHLAVGIPILMFGLLDKRRVFVREDAKLELVPALGPRCAAASVRLRF